MPKKIDLQHLKNRWPSSIVARSQIREFTGGALGPGRIANLDSEGKGPHGRIRIGRKVCYHIDDLVEWLEQRSHVLS